MKYLVIAALILTSCGAFKKNEDTGGSDSPKLADVQAVAQTYIKLIGDPYRLVSRCDSLTHTGNFSAGAPGIVDIYKHEYTYDKATGTKTYGQGWIHRSKEPCNTNLNGEDAHMDSRSEVSKENVLAWFHNMITLKDNAAILRTIRMAKDDNWCFAHGGDDGYNCMPDFGPLFSDWEKKLSAGLMLAEDADAIAIPKLEGYRGNVLGSYLLLKGRAFGYLRGVEVESLRTLVATVPTSPLYHGILHRFTDGDQSKALKLMMDQREFPRDALPADKGEAGFKDPFAWGDHKTSALLYVWTTGVLSGI